MYVLLSSPQEEASDFIISWPGEYDYAGMIIKGIGQAEGSQVSFVVMMEDLRVGFVSSPLQAWSSHDLEVLGDLDVLIVPGDDAKLVQKLVEEVDPPVTIPLQTKTDAWSEVLSACGAKDAEPVKEAKLTKSGLPKDAREVVVLEG